MGGFLAGDDGGCWHLGHESSWGGESFSNDEEYLGLGGGDDEAMWPPKLLHSQ